MSWCSKIIGAAFLLSAIAAAWANLPLTFDGSYYLISILETRQIMAPHNRLSAGIITLPTQFAVALTENLEAASLAFCLAYALVPFLAILACWLIARKSNNELMIWPLLSIGLLSAVSQTNQISENLIACQLAWPLIFSALILKGRLATALNILFAVFLIFLHPVSIIFLTIAALISFFNRAKGNKTEIVSALTLLALAAWRLWQLLLGGNDYEQAMLQADSLLDRLNVGFAGLLLPISFISLWLALVQLRTPISIKFQRLWLVGTTILPLALGALIICWSANLQLWHQCLPYSRFLFAPVTLLMFYAIYEKVTELKPTSRLTTFKDGRAGLSCLIALIFASAALVQSFQWSACTARFKSELLNSKKTVVCLEDQDWRWLQRTPLNHWSVLSLAIIEQGRNPKTILLTADALEKMKHDGDFRTAPWEGKFTNRFFKLPESMRVSQ